MTIITDHCAEANVAFELAISQGRLSADRAAPNFTGNYMFMGSNKGVDQFKHINTRRYLAPKGWAVAETSVS